MRRLTRQTPVRYLADAFGVEGVPHLTATDKGTMTLYSSWPSMPFSQQAQSSTVGEAMTEAVKLALDIYDHAAGGYGLEYLPLSSETGEYPGVWDAEREMANADQAANDPWCMAYLGTFSSRAAEVSLPILNLAEPPVPVVSGANTAPGLSCAIAGVTREWEPLRYYPTRVRHFLRVAPTDDAQARAAANWIVGQGQRRAAVLHDGTGYGYGMAKVFADTLVSLGGEVPAFAPWVPDARSYAVLAWDVAAIQPDHVYVAGIETPFAARMISEVRRVVGPGVTLLLADGLMSDEMIANAKGDGLEGAIATSFNLPSDHWQGPAVDWANALRARLTEYEPDVWCTGAFEATVAVIQAIDAVGDANRAAILDVLRGLTNFRGITGSWDFDANGDRSVVPIAFYVVEGGRFVVRDVVETRSAAAT